MKGWVGRVTDELTRNFEQGLVGRPCAVERREHDWFFDFGDGRSLAASVPWRLVGLEAILIAEADDGHAYGRPSPVDAQQEANAVLEGATVERVLVDTVTSDLAVWFSNGLRLDVFNNSIGYEGWHASFGKSSMIALGGGGLAFY